MLYFGGPDFFDKHVKNIKFWPDYEKTHVGRNCLILGDWRLNVYKETTNYLRRGAGCSSNLKSTARGKMEKISRGTTTTTAAQVG